MLILQHFAVHVANVPRAEAGLGQTRPFIMVGPIDRSMVCNVSINLPDDGIHEFPLPLFTSNNLGKLVVDGVPYLALLVVVALLEGLKHFNFILVLTHFQRVLLLH